MENWISPRRHVITGNPHDVTKVKVVTVGDVNVGKTSLTIRYTKNEFVDAYNETIGASFYIRSIDVSGRTFMFQIWDTAGQERFRSLVPMYLRDAKIAILVYDVTSMESFKNLDGWLKDLLGSSPETVRIVLVGNKMDLSDERVVSTEVGKLFASQKNLAFIETSAKMGKNVDRLFTMLGEMLLADVDALDGSSDTFTLSPAVDLTNVNFPNRKRCCRS